jgi:hypothetical protein
MYKCLLGILTIIQFSTKSLSGQIYHGPFQVGLDLSNPRTVLYAGIGTGLNLNSHLPYNKWEVVTTNGTAVMKEGGMILVTPEFVRKDSIYLYYISDSSEKKLAYMVTLMVEPLPTPQIIAGKNNKISPTELKNLKSLIARIPNIQYYIPFFIKQCKVVTVKATGEKTSFTQAGNVISDEIKKHFQTLQKGDVILIKDVKVIRENNDVIEDADGVFLTVT